MVAKAGKCKRDTGTWAEKVIAGMKEDERYGKGEILRNTTLDFEHGGMEWMGELVIAESENNVNSPFLNKHK